MNPNVHSTHSWQGVWIVFLIMIIACSASGGNTAWIASIKQICVQVEQSYPGVGIHTEPIAEELEGVLGRMGIQTTEGQNCPATLSVKIQITPDKKKYTGKPFGCYTEVEVSGKAIISGEGNKTTSLPLKNTISGAPVIYDCPSTALDAPLELAWSGAIVPLLREWWGTNGLISALKSDRYLFRQAAAKELGEMGADASEAVPMLVEMLKDPDPIIRAAAAEALGKLGPIANGAVPALIEATNDIKEGVRYASISALGEIGTDEAIKALIQSLGHQDSYARYQATEALRKLGPKAAPAVPALVKAIHDESNQVGTTAVLALQEIGPGAMEAVPELIGLLEGLDASFYDYAEGALKKITGQDFGKDAKAWRAWWDAQH